MAMRTYALAAFRQPSLIRDVMEKYPESRVSLERGRIVKARNMVDQYVTNHGTYVAFTD